ncbi:MAG: hypothetical protein OES09_05440 [Gammaproteobacteria bacterium]|nr:hypothetical protein [Gammaproteobacteria bacterium]
MTAPTNWVLGESNDALHTSDRGEAGAIITALISQAHRHVAVAAPRLDHPIFMSEEVYAGLSHLSAAHPRNTVRLLIEDVDFFLSKNPRLITLCRRFSTYVKVHRIPEHQLPFTEMLLVVDDAGFAHQPAIDKPILNASFSDRARCRQLLHRYNEMWEHSALVEQISILGL